MKVEEKNKTDLDQDKTNNQNQEEMDISAKENIAQDGKDQTTESLESSIAAILIEQDNINLSVQQQEEFSGSLSGSNLMSFINLDPAS